MKPSAPVVTTTRRRWLMIATALPGIGLAHADPKPRLLAQVPQVPRTRSSHAAAATMVAAYLKLTDPQRSLTATQGDIEAAIYSCQCKQNLHYWHLAPGLVTWAGANRKLVSTQERAVCSAKADERATFDQVQAELTAGRPVIVTFVFDSASNAGLHQACDSQQRFSVVGLGLEIDRRWLILQAPTASESDPQYEAFLAATESYPKSPVGMGWRQWKWNPDISGNVVLTYVRP